MGPVLFNWAWTDRKNMPNIFSSYYYDFFFILLIITSFFYVLSSIGFHRNYS